MSEGEIAKIAIIIAFISLGVLWFSSLNTYVANEENSYLLNKTGTAIIIKSYNNSNH